MENQTERQFDLSNLRPVRVSRQFLYRSKKKALSELKEAFSYASIKNEPVDFDQYGCLIERREKESGPVSLTNLDIRLSPFPLAKYLMAIYLVDEKGLQIKRNIKICKQLDRV